MGRGVCLRSNFPTGLLPISCENLNNLIHILYLVKNLNLDVIEKFTMEKLNFIVGWLMQAVACERSCELSTNN